MTNIPAENKFYTLTISRINRETDDAMTLYFDIPQEHQKLFKYKPGQYLTLKFKINEENYTRSYSISTSPNIDSELAITIKKVKNGFVSHFINDTIIVGDTVEVMPPKGNFIIDISIDSQREYFFFAGGSGITPLFSIIKSILHFENKSLLTLFYSNQSEKSVIFQKELNKLSELYSNRFQIIYIFTSEEYNNYEYYGRIDKDEANNLLRKFIVNNIQNAEYFLCGVPEMMQSIENGLSELKVPKNKIHKELFTNFINEEMIAENLNIEPDNSTIITKKVQVKLYGEDFIIKVEPDETILTSAMRQGYDPPFSCQIGACSTCRAKLISGKVHMDERDALTDEEIEMGYILTCQSHPLTDNVIVNYDD